MDLKKQAELFEDYIKYYDQIKYLSDRLKTDPVSVLKFLIAIGEQVLLKSTEVLLEEVDNRLKPYLVKNKIEINKNTIDEIAAFVLSKFKK